MKNYVSKKRIFALLFLIALFSFSGYNAYENREALLENVKGQIKERSFDSESLETTMSEEISRRYTLIEIYGGLQKAMGKREFNNFSFVKDEDGFLHYGAFFREEDQDLIKYAIRVRRLKDFAEQHGTKMLFVFTPSKYDKERTVLKKGIPVNDPESRTREMVLYLRRLGIETIDLGEYLPGDIMPYDETFFRTDHHWTVPAAFEASKIIASTINEKFGEKLDADHKYLVGSAYTSKVYKGGMLGSMGRKTGAVYGGLEDCTVLFPNHKGHYERYCTNDNGYEQHRKGSFEEALMSPEVLDKDNDYYRHSQYEVYLDGLRTLESIENMDAPDDAPSMFMIRDSYFSPVMSFLMPVCSRMDAVWMLHEKGGFRIEDYLKKQYDSGIKYDYIIMEIYPYNIEDKAFRFFRED